MDWKQFWKIVEDAYCPDPINHFESLMERLSELKWFEVIEFQARFDEAIVSANLRDLWGAATLINGGCSDDGFRDFRVWLVGRGRHAYERAMKNPDSLAGILDGDSVDGFGLDAAALRVYEEQTGMSDFYVRLDRAEKDVSTSPPAGLDWDFEDETEMRKRFPKLCRLYLTPDDERDKIVEGD